MGARDQRITASLRGDVPGLIKDGGPFSDFHMHTAHMCTPIPTSTHITVAQCSRSLIVLAVDEPLEKNEIRFLSYKICIHYIYINA